MINTNSSIYCQQFQHYVDAGYQPRPVEPGAKMCRRKGWQNDVATVAMPRGHNHGIGLRLGTRFADGSQLVAVDVDHEDFVRLAHALVSSPCGRIGAKGIALFARVTNETTKFDLKLANGGKAGELLGVGSLCVVPPTVHPHTGKPYRWTDKPLLEISWQELPLVEPKFIKAVFTSKHLSELMTGSETHDATLMLVAQLAKISDDYDYIKRVVTACFPENYAGDSLKELPGIIRDTAKKFETSQWTKAKTVAAGFPDVTKNGRPRSSLPNTKIALTKMELECRHDLFKLRYLINGEAIESFVGEVSDPALLRVRERIYECFGFDPSTQTVHTAVQTLANHHRFHPVRDYLDGLKWDGVPRVDNWLIRYAGADDSEYVRAVGALVLVAAVRRVREPGCKFDEILVLENPEQGNNKSSALQVLAVRREWFSDNLPLGLSAKETIEALSGHWIVEASELHGMRKSDIDKVKAFASRDTDRARLAYDRAPTAAPRQCVIIGTTNNEKYLRDLSGNRRFWPVHIVRFDLEALLRDRDQLWAETAAREASGASIRLPERLWAVAAREQQERVIENPFVSVLDTVLREKSEMVNGELVEGQPMQGKIAAEDVWTIVGVRVALRSQDKFELLGDAMKQLSWDRVRLRVGDGQRAYHYVRGPQPHRRISVVLVGNKDGTPAVPVASYDDEGRPPS